MAQTLRSITFDGRELAVDDAVEYVISKLLASLQSRKDRGDAITLRIDCAEPFLNSRGIKMPQSQHVRPSYESKAEVLLRDAVWVLCAKGYLRLGPDARSRSGGNAVLHTHGGVYAYSLTEYGERWLTATAEIDAPPVETSRFARVLSGFDKFGDGYSSRSSEAVACYHAGLDLACCVMCGAAAESIMLATASARVDDEEQVIGIYDGRDGRREVEKRITANHKDWVKENWRGYMDLLKHWRDDSAHGKAIPIGHDEAYLSLTHLLRFAQWVTKNWELLTEPKQ